MAALGLDMASNILEAKARDIWESGQGMSFPALFELRSRRGQINIMGDMFEEIAKAKSGDRNFWAHMLLGHEEAKKNRGGGPSLDAMRTRSSGILGVQALAAACLKMSLTLCDEWCYGGKSPYAQRVEDPRGKAFLGENVLVEITLAADSKNDWSQDMLDALYARRASQASDLEKRLAFAVSMSCSASEILIDRSALWHGFLAAKEAAAIERSSRIVDASACKRTL